MNLAAEKNRKRTLLVAILLVITLVGASLTTYFFIEWRNAATSLTQSQLESQGKGYTLSQINSTAPRVSITLAFTPIPSEKTVPPNTVTYLTGVVTATNLTELFYPCTMMAEFNVTYASTNPNATIEYYFIPQQIVYLMKGIQRVEIPWGLFPLALYNMNLGDQITLSATARVIIVWQPVGAIMTDQTVTTLFTIHVGGI